MKKIYLLPFLIVLISFSSGNAQITKGSLLVGGNISVYTMHTDAEGSGIDYKQDGFIFSPLIGKAIKDNLVFGAGVIYSYNKYGQGAENNPSDQISNGYGATVFLRKYRPLGKNFYIYLEGGLTGRYDESDNKPLTDYNNYKKTSVSFGATPGMSYAVSRKLQLELGFSQLLSLGYSHEKGDKQSGVNSTPYKTNTFNLSSSFNNTYFSSLYFGFRLLLGK